VTPVNVDSPPVPSPVVVPDVVRELFLARIEAGVRAGIFSPLPADFADLTRARGDRPGPNRHG
jgi:hypothetical protein